MHEEGYDDTIQGRTSSGTELGRSLQRMDQRIHPIVIYPFSHPQDTNHIKALYDSLEKCCSRPNGKFFRPITVLNRQTADRGIKPKMSKTQAQETPHKFDDFLAKEVETRSEIIQSWCVDTCQMWLTGLGQAFDRNNALAAVYWLIPGDFNYDSPEGYKVLAKFEELPMYIYEERDVHLSLGEIRVPLNSSKQLIDTYGTYGLLY